LPTSEAHEGNTINGLMREKRGPPYLAGHEKRASSPEPKKAGSQTFDELEGTRSRAHRERGPETVATKQPMGKPPNGEIRTPWTLKQEQWGGEGFHSVRTREGGDSWKKPAQK